MQTLTLIGVSILLALAIAEAVFRLFPGLMSEEARLRVHWRELLNQKTMSVRDPYLGFVYPPHYEGRVESRDCRFTYTTDEHGFRNSSPWPPEAEVVAVGDSLTFGYGVDDGQTWTALSARQLGGIRLINLGLSGAAPQQYFRIYERFGTPLHPKVLLFGLFPANDLVDAAQFDRWLAAGKPGNYDVWRFFRGDVPGLRRGIVSFLNRSHLFIFLREAWKLLRYPQGFQPRTIDFPDGGRLCLAPNILARASRASRPGHADFQRVLDAIGQTRRLAESQGTHLIVLLFPSKEEVYLPIYGEPSPHPLQPFLEALRALRIEYIDLTVPFQDSARSGNRLFYEVDGHPNAEGYALVARVIVNHLRSNSKRYSLSE